VGSNTVRMAVSKAHDGWIGFGLGTQMVGSSVVIAFPTSGNGSCPVLFLFLPDVQLCHILTKYVLILWNASVVLLSVFEQHTVVGE
jgi:hypothetical protein